MLILVLSSVAAVRQEISDETDRETGRSKQISSVPIHLSIYSPNGESVMGFVFCFLFFWSFLIELLLIAKNNFLEVVT